MEKEFYPINKCIQNDLYNILSSLLKNDNLNSQNIIKVCLNLMQVIEKFKNIHGIEKRDIVLKTLQLYVTDNVTDNKDVLLFLIENVLPSMIETFISIDKKELKIKIKKSINFCCTKNKSL